MSPGTNARPATIGILIVSKKPSVTGAIVDSIVPVAVPGTRM
jgi:hypothetical protein